MDDVDERVAFLEGRVEEQGQMVSTLREAMASMEARIDRRFEQVDQRFQHLDLRLQQMDLRWEARFGSLEHRFDGLETKFSRLTGLMIAMLLAIIGGMSGIIAAILQR